jgi:hypothetical protein
MKWVLWIGGLLLWAQTGSYNPDEVIGEEEETTSTPPTVTPREEAVVRINGQSFVWQDPLDIQSGQTYTIQISGLKPKSKFIIRVFKAGQKAGATHFDANEYGEIELEVTLDKKRFKGTAEIIYYPANGKEIRRHFTVRVL